MENIVKTDLPLHEYSCRIGRRLVDCPKEKQPVALVPTDLGEGLEAQSCARCRGVWIAADDYLAWRDGQILRDEAAQEADVVERIFEHAPQDDQAALCPQCGHFLMRARAVLEPPFYLERCDNCGGIWCDGGEWDVLKTLALSVSIPHIFSPQWQAELREREREKSHAATRKELLGPQLAARVEALAGELETHPHKEVALAFLMQKLSRPAA